MQGLFIIIGVVIVLLLILTPMGRTIIRSIKNLFIADAMKNPKAAKAVFLTAIEDAQKKAADVGRVYADLTGRLKETKSEVAKAERDIEDATKRCEQLVKSGASDEDIELFAQKRRMAIQAKNKFQELQSRLEPQVEQAKAAYTLLQDEVRKLKAQKDLKIAEMEMNKALDDTYKKLNAVDTSATSRLLSQFDDNLASAKRSADGGRAMYEERTDVRESMLEKKMSEKDNDDFIASLKAQHNKGEL